MILNKGLYSDILILTINCGKADPFYSLCLYGVQTVRSEEKKDFRINDSLVVGRNAVLELIKSGREIENILVAKGEREGSVSKIL